MLIPQSPTVVEGTTISANTSDASGGGGGPHPRAGNTVTTKSTFLVIARDKASAYSAYSGLNDYGIPYELLLVPQGGATLPVLNASAAVGNYGGIVVLSEVSYGNNAGVFSSALSDDQWDALYAYQASFGARMVRLDVIPSSATGTTILGGCCADTQEQFVSVTNTSYFPTAGLVQ